MNRRLSDIDRDRKLTAAVLVATIIVGIQLAQAILSTILYLPVTISQTVESGANSALENLPGMLSGIVTNLLPFAVGVFVCLWLLAPIAADQRATSVIKRALLAAVAGTLILFLASFLFALLGSVSESDGFVYGWVSAGLAAAGGNMGWAATNALYSAGTALIYVTPLTILAGLLVWLRLRARYGALAETDGALEV